MKGLQGVAKFAYNQAQADGVLLQPEQLPNGVKFQACGVAAQCFVNVTALSDTLFALFGLCFDL